MAIYLKQSTASQEVCLGYFVDSTDGNTEETALTIANTDIKLHKAGATTLASKNSGGATHISNGIYYAVLDATDTDTLGPMVIYCHVAGALAVRVECCVLAANIYDSLIGGGDVLQVDVTQFNGTNGTFSGGRPEVNTTHAAGTAWGSGAITAASIAADAITAAKIADGAIDAATFAAGAINAAAIAADAITDAKVASDVTIASVTGAVGSVTGNVGGNVSGSVGSVVGAVGSVTGLTASDVGAIKAKTDSLTFTVAGQVDSNVQYVNDVQLQGAGTTGNSWRPV